MEDKKQPLLSPTDEFGDADRDQLHDHLESFPATAHPSFTSNASFTPDADDISPILSFRDFFREFYKETKKLWYLAGPAIFTSICQYSLGAVTQVFAGQVGTLELAAVSIENSVIAGFSFGVMVRNPPFLLTHCQSVTDEMRNSIKAAVSDIKLNFE